MCDHGDTVPMWLPSVAANGWRYRPVDRCIAPLVAALRGAGFETVASCCGHGNRPTSIALADGREIIIAPDFESARRIDKLFPTIHGEALGA